MVRWLYFVLMFLPFFCLAQLPASEVYTGLKYDHPLLFPPEKNGFNISLPILGWDLSKGSKLVIGNWHVRSGGFAIRGEGESKSPTVQLSFPAQILSEGRLDVVDEQGKMIFSREWQDQSELTVGRADDVASILSAQRIRLCVATSEKQAANFVMCSGIFRVLQDDSGIKVEMIANSFVPKVFLFEQSVALVGQREISPSEQGGKFTAVFSDGTSLQFSVHVSPLKIIDTVIQDEKIMIRGLGDAPSGEVEWVNRWERSFWDATMGEKSELSIWTQAISIDKPVMNINTELGALFFQRLSWLNLAELPRQAQRIQMSHSGRTYQNSLEMVGKTAGAKVVSGTGEVQSLHENYFFLQIPMQKKGEAKEVELKSQDGEIEREALYRVYRGVPYELSGRLSLIGANEDVLLIGELSTNMWFEKLFGWESRDWSLHRWGVAMKYGDLFAQTGGGKAKKYQQTLIDLKYSLQPGLTSWDESYGLILATRDTILGQDKAAMGGLGVYWARSLPYFFDNLFRWVPLVGGYPKWVDADAIYYLLRFDNGDLRENYLLNFHGKVLWTPVLFGEAGFSINKVGFKSVSKKAKDIVIIQGTIGIGWYF